MRRDIPPVTDIAHIKTHSDDTARPRRANGRARPRRAIGSRYGLVIATTLATGLVIAIPAMWGAVPASAAAAGHGHQPRHHRHHAPGTSLHWVKLTPAQAKAPHEITNGAHGLCLDAVASHDGSNGDPVQLWHCHGTSDMEWSQNLHTFTFTNVAHGLCLDANASGDGRDGDKVQLWKCTGKSNQSWSTQAGNFQIQNGAHGLCLDANASDDGRNGDKVQLWRCKTEPGHPDETWS